jgi:hypothetical protein
MTKMKDVVKSAVKKAAPPSKGNVDPSDPWSATGSGGGIPIPENVTSRRADLLSKFYKSKGYNINYVSKNQRIAQSKKGEFDKWKADHGIYEEDDISEDLTTHRPIGAGNLLKHRRDKSDTLKRTKEFQKAAKYERIKKYAKIPNQREIPLPQGSMREDNINDPQSATQAPFDAATCPNDVAPAPKKNKAAKMVKEIYAKHRLKEDMYDHEKDDKGPGTNVKDPKVIKQKEVNDDNEKGTNARMVLKGGTTMTGEKRDTIEIDPMLKNRGKQPDYIATNTGKKTNQ